MRQDHQRDRGGNDAQAHERQVSKILCSDYDFSIPAYQRPYAWEPEQSQELLEDLPHALDNSSQEPYFLGSIVLVKPSDDPECDVIDGQQRLTTLTILLAVLRELTRNGAIRQGLNLHTSEPGNELQEIPSRPRLTLRDRHREFFWKYVQNPGGLAKLIKEPGAPTKNYAQVQYDPVSAGESMRVLPLIVPRSGPS